MFGFSKPAQPEKVTVVRLSPEMMADLRRRLGGAGLIVVSGHTTDIQSGYMLGVNHVLNVLQEGFVIERP